MKSLWAWLFIRMRDYKDQHHYDPGVTEWLILIVIVVSGIGAIISWWKSNDPQPNPDEEQQ